MVFLNRSTISAFLFLLVSTSPIAQASELASNGSNSATTNMSNIKSLPDDELRQALETESALGNPDYCNKIPAILAEMVRRGTFSSGVQQAKHGADLQCAVIERRWSSAYDKLLIFEKSSQQSTEKFGFDIARIAGQEIAAVERLERMASAPDATSFLDVDAQQLFDLSRNLGQKNQEKYRERLFKAVYNSPHFKKSTTDYQSSVADSLFDIEIARGKFVNSQDYIKLFSSIYVFRGKLANRKYEKFWPELERAAGPNMTLIVQRNVENALAHYEADKQNRLAFQRAAHALLFAGKFEEAVMLVQTFDHGTASILAMTEDDAWALNVEAFALDALGKSGEADRVFDLIASIPYRSGENGWLVNFVINRALRLVELGKWQAGYDAAILAETVTEKSGSPYAGMLVRQAKGCALVKLGRGKEAASIFDAMFAARKDAYAAAAGALLCAGDDDRAAQVVNDALNDKDGDGDVIADMQKPEFQTFYSRSMFSRLRERLRDRADVKSRFDKVAREIPDYMMPLGGLRREQLKR